MHYDQQAPDLYHSDRQAMVDLIAERGVRNQAVLQAMLQVPRDVFVPADLRGVAHADRPLPIGSGQTISQPYMVAFMSSAARLSEGDRVLEVGTGCGYQAAVLLALGAEVYTMEIVPELAATARVRLGRIFSPEVMRRLHIREGDAFAGWPEAAPFKAIVVTAAPTRVPPALLAQLAEGGRLVIPLGTAETGQELHLYRRTGSQMRHRDLFGVRFVPMTGAAQQASGSATSAWQR